MRRRDFAHDLIKGKIAEIIFELLFRESGRFSVFRFGYEYTEEYLAQYRDEFRDDTRSIINEVSSSPDFIFITDENREGKRGMYVVEVKYRSETEDKELVAIAEKLVERWKSPWLFLISREDHKFYFVPAHVVKNKKGLYQEDNRLSDFIEDQRLLEKYKNLAEDWLWRHKEN